MVYDYHSIKVIKIHMTFTLWIYGILTYYNTLTVHFCEAVFCLVLCIA